MHSARVFCHVRSFEGRKFGQDFQDAPSLAYFSSAGYPILSAARRKIYDKTRDRRISSYLMDHSPLLSNRGAFLDITVGLGTVDFHKRKKERGRSLMKELKMNSL